MAPISKGRNLKTASKFRSKNKPATTINLINRIRVKSKKESRVVEFKDTENPSDYLNR